MNCSDDRLRIVMFILLIFHACLVGDLKHKPSIEISGPHQSRIKTIKSIEFITVDGLIEIAVLDEEEEKNHTNNISAVLSNQMADFINSSMILPLVKRICGPVSELVSGW